MESPKTSATKSALNFGTMLGLVLMIISLIIFVFEMYEAKWLSYISYIILIVGIIMGIKRRRDQERGGVISYGQSLGYGTLVAFFAGLIGAIVLFMYLKFVDDGFIQYNIELQEAQMYEAGLPDEQIEQSMMWTKKFSNPTFYSVMGLVANVFFGFIISLIASAFLKKEPDNFDDTE
ncbi:MAG: DUF4199 domain-containing protein [Vicingaceae bacterium]